MPHDYPCMIVISARNREGDYTPILAAPDYVTARAALKKFREDNQGTELLLHMNRLKCVRYFHRESENRPCISPKAN
jgi:hypothetical protein